LNITESELKKHISSSKFEKVYFLYGEENYLSAHYAGLIASKVVGGHPLAEFNYQKFDGNDCTVGEIQDAVEALPVMAERKCVVVRDFDVSSANSAAVEQLNSMIQDLPESVVLVFWLDAVNADVKKNSKWKGFLASVEKAGASVYFPRKTQSELVQILCKRAQDRGCTLEPGNAKYLIERAGNDLRLLLGEMEKLCALAGSGEITREHIESISVQNLEASVFDLSKAILKGSYAQAYRILDGLFAQREEPVAILAVLSNAYADMYRAKVALSSGVRPEALSDDFNYRSSFRLTNAARDCQRIPLKLLRKSLEILAQADMKLKSTGADKRIVLEQTAAKLILLHRIGESA